MSVDIDSYWEGVRTCGYSKVDAMKLRAKLQLLRKSERSFSRVTIQVDGTENEAMILNKPDHNEKKLLLLRGDLKAGSVIEWNGSHWLVMSTDKNDVLYPSGTINRCNYILKFKNASGELVQKYCVITDVTKYLIGEAWKPMMTIGDSRMSLAIPRDMDTASLKRGTRLLIDDPIADETCAYEITKPDRVTNVYDGDGIYKYLCREVNSADTDNKAELIPDNEKYMPGAPEDQTGGWF